MRLLLHYVKQALPGEVYRNALGLLENDPHLVEWVDNLDAVVVDVLVEAILVDRIREVHRGLYLASPDQNKCVFDTEVRVVPNSADKKDVSGAVVRVEV